MAEDVKPRIRVPSSAKKDEVIEIKTLVSHPMESGQRKNAQGQTIPRRIINKMTVAYNGKPVFEAKLEAAISANPYISFFLKATESGIWNLPGPTTTAPSTRQASPSRSPEARPARV